MAAAARSPLIAGAFGLLRRVATAPASVHWVRTQIHWTDDGVGGRLQSLRRGVKFWVRCWWNTRALQLSTAVFRDSGLDAVATACPELPLRPLRSYLRRGLVPERRALAMRAHFEWLAQDLPRSVVDGLYTGRSFALLDAATSPVDGLGLTLAAAAGLGREGELALHLQWQGVVVMSLAFSVMEAQHVLGRDDAAPGAGRRIVVGALQGVRGADAHLRDLSRAAQRLRPSALLVLAVQALGGAWGLAPALGVAARSHVYAGYASRRRKVALDYDTAWAEVGAQRTSRHYWTLPALPVLRPDSDVESRHRAQHRRRNALREVLLQTVRHSATAIAAPSAAGQS